MGVPDAHILSQRGNRQRTFDVNRWYDGVGEEPHEVNPRRLQSRMNGYVLVALRVILLATAGEAGGGRGGRGRGKSSTSRERGRQHCNTGA